jgi:formylglycine-generating enzyme required for sulfatase activity
MPTPSHFLLALVATALLVLASCGGGDVAVGGGAPTPVSYRVLDLGTGAVTTVSGINLGDPLYTTTRMVFRQVPAGTLTRGSLPGSLGHQSDEAPGTTTVAMPAMWVAVLELTQGQWSALTGDAANQPWRSVTPAAVTGSLPTGATLPAFGLTEVELDAAVSAWNGSVVGSGRVAVPTNDQWEYACRGPTTTLFFWGDILTTATANSFAVTRETSGITGPQPVISGRVSNGWGLWDMVGNVREWTRDGSSHDLRGGGWSDNLLRCRSANRITAVDTFRHALSGARLVLTAP